MPKKESNLVPVMLRFKPEDYKKLFSLCDPGETVSKAVKRKVLALVSKSGKSKKSGR
ncbi:MAG: hypothetical protein PVG39_31715 [Desulfobacteraceae bacterium]|jgi:hypothetical protein